MAETIPNLLKNTKSNQEAQQNPNKIDKNQVMSGCIKLKLLKEIKKKNLENNQRIITPICPETYE